MTLDLSTELNEIVDGIVADATPVTNALVKIQDAVNAVAAAAGLPAGAAGQVLKGVGPAWGQVTDAEVAAGSLSFAKLLGFPNDLTKFARGDGIWAVPPSGAGGGGSNSLLLDSGTRTTDLSVAATTAAGAQTVVAGNAVVYDGSEVEIRFRAAEVVRGAGDIKFVLYDGATQLGLMGREESGGSVELVVPLTPTPGTHTYSVKAYVDAGTGLVHAGNGSAGNYYPATLRVVSRTLVGTIAPLVYAKDYGVQADGVSDDTAAVLAAIAALPVKPVIGGNAVVGTVLLPPGRIVVSGLVMPNTQTFAGAGSGASGTAYGNYFTLMGSGGFWGGTTLVRKAATDNVLIDASGTIAAGPTITRSCGLRLENLAVDGQGGTKPLLRCYYASTYGLRNVRFENNAGPAVEGVEWQDSRIENCAFLNCAGATETNATGTVTGQESLRLLGNADGNPASPTFGWTNDNCNNLFFVGCLFTPSRNPNAGAIALSANNTGGLQSPHRIYFIDNKIEAANVKGDMVKLRGGSSRVQWIYFLNCDFTGYSLGTGAAAISWIYASTAYSCVVRDCLFDDANTAGVTHAPFKLTDAEFWTIDAVSTNLGTAGGEANPACLIDCTFSNGQPLVIGNVRHLGSRTTPWFSNAAIADRRLPVKGGVSTSTPGVVNTVSIPHGLGYTPQNFDAQPGDANARGAPAYHVTRDATNVILNFVANLTAATAYTWNWTAG